MLASALTEGTRVMGSKAWRKFTFGLMFASFVGATLLHVARADADGAAEYRARCASCHGEDGTGDGPAASALRNRPSDLRLLAKKNGGVFPGKVIETVIDGRKTIRAHGNFEMPVWGQELSQSAADGEAAKRILAIIGYLRNIQLK
jgi:mono/diheme cytochrome c family protein